MLAEQRAVEVRRLADRDRALRLHGERGVLAEPGRLHGEPGGDVAGGEAGPVEPERGGGGGDARALHRRGGADGHPGPGGEPLADRGDRVGLPLRVLRRRALRGRLLRHRAVRGRVRGGRRGRDHGGDGGTR
nr:MAG: hypothetical protein DIU60_05935 [Actinomycetota bacterium]